MRKYDVWFCICGTIQAIDPDHYEWLQEDYANRCIIRVCKGCGKVERVWLTAKDDGFAVNVCEMEDVELTSENMKNTRVLMYKGIRVPIKNGGYATMHVGSFWSDANGIGEVDTEQLIQTIKDRHPREADNILLSIAGVKSGIDWRNTSYETTIKRQSTEYPTELPSETATGIYERSF